MVFRLSSYPSCLGKQLDSMLLRKAHWMGISRQRVSTNKTTSGSNLSWVMQEASELWSDQHAWFPGSPEVMSPQQPASPAQTTPLTEAKQPFSAMGLSHIWQASASDQSGATLRARNAKLPDGGDKASLSLPDHSAPLGEPDRVPQLEHGMKEDDKAWTIAAKVVTSQVGTAADMAAQHNNHCYGNEVVHLLLSGSSKVQGCPKVCLYLSFFNSQELQLAQLSAAVTERHKILCRQLVYH